MIGKIIRNIELTMNEDGTGNLVATTEIFNEFSKEDEEFVFRIPKIDLSRGLITSDGCYINLELKMLKDDKGGKEILSEMTRK